MSKEKQMIERYYGDERANRSGVPLINHINEGASVILGLDFLDDRRKNVAARAFCLHPMVQARLTEFPGCGLAGMGEYMDDEAMRLGFESRPWSFDVLNLAFMYSVAANAYLCTDDKELTWPEISQQVGGLHLVVRAMLIADKIQNKKDFDTYHRGRHKNSDRLGVYFDLWLRYLDVEESAVARLTTFAK